MERIKTITSVKRKVVEGVILTTVLLVVFCMVQPVAARPIIPHSDGIQNISVEVAHKMLKKSNSPRPLVLDVRYQCEYNMGHLFNALLLPYSQLEANMSKLDAYKNHEIIVYCKSGNRSQIACDILSQHGFTKIYNMEGGIIAWINAGFQIYTTYHHVTVNVIDQDLLLQIQPSLIYQPDSVPCACTQNLTESNNQTDYQPTNIQPLLIEQDESHSIVNITYEANGTNSEFTITNTLLWSYSEQLSDEGERSARFEVMEVVGQDWFSQYYSLSYFVRHSEYNFTIQTILVPLGSDAYNSAFTVVSYVPADMSEIVTGESVDFNSSVSLSTHYKILGIVANKIGNLYGKSGNEVLEQFASSYRTMSEETKYLSKLVKHYLSEYDREILSASTLLLDTEESDVFACLGSILICLAAIFATPQVLAECGLCYQLIICVAACLNLFTIWWCVACIATGILGCLLCAGGFLAILDGCYTAGHCLGIW